MYGIPMTIDDWPNLWDLVPGALETVSYPRVTLLPNAVELAYDTSRMIGWEAVIEDSLIAVSCRARGPAGVPTVYTAYFGPQTLGLAPEARFSGLTVARDGATFRVTASRS